MSGQETRNKGVVESRIINGVEYPIIRPRSDMPLSRGVYVGIVVGFEQSQHLKDLFAEIRALVEPNQDVLQILTTVKDKTRESMPNSDYYAVGYLGVKRQKERRANGDELNIDDFLEEGKGFCVQYTIVSAIMIEQLVNAGILEGRVFTGKLDVDKGDFGIEGHVWAEFHTDGKKYVVDPAYNFAGSQRQYWGIKQKIIHQIWMSD